MPVLGCVAACGAKHTLQLARRSVALRRSVLHSSAPASIAHGQRGPARRGSYLARLNGCEACRRSAPPSAGLFPLPWTHVGRLGVARHGFLSGRLASASPSRCTGLLRIASLGGGMASGAAPPSVGGRSMAHHTAHVLVSASRARLAPCAHADEVDLSFNRIGDRGVEAPPQMGSAVLLWPIPFSIWRSRVTWICRLVRSTQNQHIIDRDSTCVPHEFNIKRRQLVVCANPIYVRHSFNIDLPSTCRYSQTRHTFEINSNIILTVCRYSFDIAASVGPM